jgi:DNA-binding NarL/FixJ family response regulator
LGSPPSIHGNQGVDPGMNGKAGGSILLVDDEKPMRRLLEQVLTENGYACRSAVDAKAAKLQLQQQRFDLVLSDIRMPGESGLDLCRHIKRTFPDTPCMLITAVDDMATATEAITLGIYGYIIKPITNTQLLISVANALKHSRLEASQRDYREELETAVREKTSDLLKTTEDLERQQIELNELNTALSVLLRKMEKEKEAIETRLVENVTKCVLPYFENLKKSRLSESQKLDLDIAEKNIRDIVSPFTKKISSPLLNLTQSEIQVANLIKQGMSTKEIASALNLSTNTIMTHRAHIREKLDLKTKKEPLYTHLSSLG